MAKKDVCIHSLVPPPAFLINFVVCDCRYREGSLQARGGLSEATSSAVGMATRELVSLTESHGAGTVEEEDIDELLKWTNGLNYDKSVYSILNTHVLIFINAYCRYVAEWQSSASSAVSSGQ